MHEECDSWQVHFRYLILSSSLDHVLNPQIPDIMCPLYNLQNQGTVQGRRYIWYYGLRTWYNYINSTIRRETKINLFREELGPFVVWAFGSIRICPGPGMCLFEEWIHIPICRLLTRPSPLKKTLPGQFGNADFFFFYIWSICAFIACNKQYLCVYNMQ